MATAVICEFNPFHNGHKYLLESAKNVLKEPIIAIINTMTHNYSGLMDTLKRLSITDTGEVNSILRLSDYGRKGTTVWKLIANTCWSDIGAKGRYLIAALNKTKRR